MNNAVGDAKTRQMESYTQHQDKSTPLTTYFGTKIAETDVALRAGARGPTVLEGMSEKFRFFSEFLLLYRTRACSIADTSSRLPQQRENKPL